MPRRVAPGWAAATFGLDRTGERITTGVSDLVTAMPVTMETRFRWFSVTKLVTAAAVLCLVEDGDLDLDAPVVSHLPWFQPRPPRPAITARHLLSHASGLADPLAIGWVHPPGDPLRAPGELTQQTFQRYRDLKNKPGDRARYSNLGYLVLGELVAALSGEPFEVFVARRILGLLGTERTNFSAGDAATGHESLIAIRSAAMMVFVPRARRLVRYARGGWVGLHPFTIEGQSYGGLVGSLGDLVRFGRCLLAAGAIDGRRLLDPESVRAMHQRHAAGPDGTFGLGFQLRGGWAFHAGEAGGFRALLQLHPERGVGIAVLANNGAAPVEGVAGALSS